MKLWLLVETVRDYWNEAVVTPFATEEEAQVALVKKVRVILEYRDAEELSNLLGEARLSTAFEISTLYMRTEEESHVEVQELKLTDEILNAVKNHLLTEELIQLVTT